MTIHIGTSGWSYDHWHGVLYPHGLPAADRLAHYVQHYDTVEINSTFYRWPSAAVFRSWARRTPPTFRISLKAPRALTHAARLYAPEARLARIQANVSLFGDKRGVLLVQLPPNLDADYPRLAYFLEQLPPWLQVTIEFRHPSWHTEATFALLERYGVAYCVMSGAHLPCILRATAPFVYVRLHGPDRQRLYAGSYPDTDLHWWAERVCEWERMGREVFVYFNNDGDGNAVRNAWTFRGMIGRG